MQEKDTQQDGQETFEKICYVCRRPESKAGPMISMPGGMNFCHACMQKAFDSVTQGGIDFSKLQNMPYMNLNLSDISGLAPGAAEIPQKNKVKKKGTEKKKPEFTMKDVPAPHRIKARLDEYIIGQEKAKKAISVAVYNHYKRVFLKGQETEKDDEIVIELKVAPSDMGKVIGKQGRIAKAIRSVVKAASSKTEKKVIVEIQ